MKVRTKTFCRLVATIACGVSIMLTSGAASAADLVVAAFGGVWEQSLRQCIVAPFEQKTGKKVDIVLGAPAQSLNQIAANPSKPPIDIAFLPSDSAFEAIRRGLIERMDSNKAPHVKEIPARFSDPNDGYGVVMNYGAMGVIYNSKTIPNPPKTWKDFTEGTVAGQWKASIPSVNYPAGGLLPIWMYTTLYGGNINDISPGLAQIKRMVASGNLMLWTDPNQVLNALKSGEIDIAMYWDGRAWAFIDPENKDFKYYTPEPGGAAALTHIQKVKGSAEIGWDFIDIALSAGPQACFANRIRYGVTNKNVVYDPKIKPQITDLSLLLIPPYKEFASFQSKWVEQWNKEIGR